VYTSSIVLTDISRKYFKEGFDANIVKDRIRLIGNLSIIVYIENDLAIKSGKCCLGGGSIRGK